MDIVEDTIRTYDKIAPEYCERTRDQKFLVWEEEYIEELLACIRESTPLVLDVGCGDGRHCAIIDENGGKAIGIDLSDSMLAESKALYPDGDFQKMDMRHLTFEYSSFDGIWSSGSIYHVTKADIRKVIEEFRRVLKPDGVAAVNFKMGTGEGLEQNPRSYAGSPRYFAYYTEQEMQTLFEDSGFRVLKSCMYPEKIFGDDIQQMWFRLEKP